MRLIQFGFALLVLLGLSACSNDDDFGGSGLQTQSFSVYLNYDDQSFNGKPVNQGEVILTNTNTGDAYQATSGSKGVASFEAVLPGTYNVSASLTLNAQTFEQNFGYAPSSEEVIFNASQENVVVNANTISVNLTLDAARIGDLVIKQIYYAGSDTKNGALFRDQFIEIYNNSNEVIYADGLYVAQLYGRSKTNSAAYTLPTGQFDWSQSIGMSMGIQANTNYVYADYVLQVPGSGTDYPLQPGESFVIAQNALNHKQPLVDNNGDPIEIGDPSLTVDLSSAEFEVYLGDFRVAIGEQPYQWDIQNPAVQDVNLAFWGRENYFSNNKDFVLDSFGRDSFAIFRADDQDFAAYANYSDPSVVQIEDNTNFYLQIPVAQLIDGVDLQHYNPSSQRPKMLSPTVDASAISVDGIYNSQSVMRKTKTTVNGRKILEDSNNSALDFEVMNKAIPKGF